MNLGQSIKQNYAVYSDQDHAKALTEIAELRKKVKELENKIKLYNRLSRLKK